MSENFSKNMRIFGIKKGEESTNFKNKKFKKLRVIILLLILIFVIFIFFLYFHSQFVIEKILSEEQIFYQDKITQLNTAKERISKEDYYPISPRLVRTFGDNFTGLSYINRGLSDMYWERQVSAFLFPPRLSVQKIKDCQKHACGYYIQEESWQGFCNQNNCLEKDGKQLIYNGDNLNLPEEVDKNELVSISLGGIGGNWYVGFILGKNDQDKDVWVYRFDGKKYIPIINNNSDISFPVRGGRLNGYLSFGGSQEDLYIVYGGYFGQIKRLKNEEKLIDLTEFFSLRFTNHGFFSKIQTSEEAQAIYICNTKSNRVNILKLWKSKDDEVIGSVDLKNLILKEIPAIRIDCLPGNDKYDLRVLVKTKDSWQKIGVIDRGFNNEIIRQVASSDINSSNAKIKSVIIKDYAINSEKPIEDSFQLFFSTNGEDYTPVLTRDWYKIEPPGESLYWRIIFRNDKNNQYYSPWLKNLSVINYEIIEK